MGTVVLMSVFEGLFMSVVYASFETEAVIRPALFSFHALLKF